MKVIVLFFALFICFSAMSQNYSGTWSGKMYSDMMANYRKSYKLTVQLHQQGRALWGIYNMQDTIFKKPTTCICQVTAQLEKNNKVKFNLFKGKIIQTDMDYQQCEGFLDYFTITSMEKDGHKMFTGNWTGTGSSQKKMDGTSGTVYLQKVSDSTLTDVDRYFPKLPKLIRKFNPGDTAYSRN